MGIRELHPLGRQPVNVGCRDLRLRIEALRIAPAHVIDEDDEDIGFGRGGGVERCQRSEQECGEEDAFHGRVHLPLPFFPFVGVGFSVSP